MEYIVKALIKGKDLEYKFDNELMAETFAMGIRSIGYAAVVVEREAEYV